MLKKLAVVIVILIGASQWWGSRPITHGPGMVAPGKPVQSPDVPADTFAHNGYTLTPLARFRVQARVLGKEEYGFDRESDLAPIDLALGWGPMSDESVLEKIDISQSSRFYRWRVDEFPIPRREIETNSANMHLIPSTEEIWDELSSVRPGQVVDFKGYLVKAVAPDNWRWKSSMTREDTGTGACELVWVEQLLVN